MVICLERDADLHMAQLMPLPLTVSCFSKIQIDFTFLVLAHLGSPGKGPLNGCVQLAIFHILKTISTFTSLCCQPTDNHNKSQLCIYIEEPVSAESSTRNNKNRQITSINAKNCSSLCCRGKCQHLLCQRSLILYPQTNIHIH